MCKVINIENYKKKKRIRLMFKNIKKKLRQIFID